MTNKIEHLRIRLLTNPDQSFLLKWLSNPLVLQYYEGRDNPYDLLKVQQHFYRKTDSVTRCMIEYKSVPIGYIQYYPLDNVELKEYGYSVSDRVYGTDQFIGEPVYWNKGIGQFFVSKMIKYLFEEIKANIVVMDPQVSNVRAIACYEKCGLQKKKILKKHEKHEGEWRDCWLMGINRVEYNLGL